MISHYIRTMPLASALSFLLLFSSLNAQADSEIYTGYFSSTAVSGYDPVAYFTEGLAKKGKSQFSTRYKGADWNFKNDQNRQAFIAQPLKYAPQYGGYCAWAVAHNTTAKGDPQQWTIVDDKLYLNYDAQIQEKWLKDKAILIKKANKHWPSVL